MPFATVNISSFFSGLSETKWRQTSKMFLFTLKAAKSYEKCLFDKVRTFWSWLLLPVIAATACKVDCNQLHVHHVPLEMCLKHNRHRKKLANKYAFLFAKLKKSIKQKLNINFVQLDVLLEILFCNCLLIFPKWYSVLLNNKKVVPKSFETQVAA